MDLLRNMDELMLVFIIFGVILFVYVVYYYIKLYRKTLFIGSALDLHLMGVARDETLDKALSLYNKLSPFEEGRLKKIPWGNLFYFVVYRTLGAFIFATLVTLFFVSQGAQKQVALDNSFTERALARAQQQEKKLDAIVSKKQVWIDTVMPWEQKKTVPKKTVPKTVAPTFPADVKVLSKKQILAMPVVPKEEIFIGTGKSKKRRLVNPHVGLCRVEKEVCDRYNGPKRWLSLVDFMQPEKVIKPFIPGYEMVEVASAPDLGFWLLPRKPKFRKKDEVIEPLSDALRNTILLSPFRRALFQSAYFTALAEKKDSAIALTVVATLGQESLGDKYAMSGKYGKQMPILKDGIPTKLSGAMGPCQFLPATAKEQGLKENEIWDVRKCTLATIRYLDSFNKRILTDPDYSKKNHKASNILMKYNRGYNGAKKIITKKKKLGNKEGREYAAKIRRWQDFFATSGAIKLYELIPTQYASK